ncbi:patatin-like phospholipase family protein [Sphingomonas radiodurans]|uniref:patatin-like phospholipase family protein n=1 Tax=Sphingomonas radiodurans TaxID=2890321 RepID=UPI001E63F438|nr:patatin-like phospholipase family protein [Sphingomonas radiodurans]WBH18141.1 patatin-like phospholipase family protein [Sphingomonas radiodurans]
MATKQDYRIVLVLAGGNALGAYQAGVYQALQEHGIEPDWVVGASVGANNGAVIAGNAPEQRLPNLVDLWRPETPAMGWPGWWDSMPDSWRRTSEAIGTLLVGRPGLFAPLGSSLIGVSSSIPALFDTSPMSGTLEQLVDFDRLNTGPVRFTATAVDLDTGEDVAFDTRDRTVGAEHIRASAALAPSFPAVEIDGQMFVDAGLSANLPLDPVLSEPPTAPTLCIAIDLLPLAGARPDTLGEVIGRAQDLVFACQSRRTIARWQELYAISEAHRAHPVTLVRLAYGNQQREVAGKAMDFSPTSVRYRWDSGYRDGVDLARRLDDGSITVSGSGLTVLQPSHEAQAFHTST